MGNKARSRSSSVTSNTRAKKFRRTISIVFRWKTPAPELPTSVPELPTNYPLRASSEIGRDPEFEREYARARLEGRDIRTLHRQSEQVLDIGSGNTSIASSPSRRGSESSGESESISYRSSTYQRSPLSMVPEDPLALSVEREIDVDGLPNYASAAFPREPVAYNFVRSSPFAMIVVGDTIPAAPRYHISVGVNVWMPTSFTTCIRRGGSEDGKVVAQLEMGITARSAVLTIGRQAVAVSSVLHKKSPTSHTRIYKLCDGSEIKWRLATTGWEAYMGPTLLATFFPATQLILQPAAHPVFDHIIIALVILMRQHLTPKSAQSGETAGLFNYLERDRHAHTYDNNDY